MNIYLSRGPLLVTVVLQRLYEIFTHVQKLLISLFVVQKELINILYLFVRPLQDELSAQNLAVTHFEKDRGYELGEVFLFVDL